MDLGKLIFSPNMERYGIEFPKSKQNLFPVLNEAKFQKPSVPVEVDLITPPQTDDEIRLNAERLESILASINYARITYKDMLNTPDSINLVSKPVELNQNL